MLADSEKESVIVTNSEILGGSFPVFRGTRVPVDTFLNHIKDGGSMEDFLTGFPTVTRAQLEAALESRWNRSDSVKRREENCY